jgi:hypothetical protein
LGSRGAGSTIRSEPISFHPVAAPPVQNEANPCPSVFWQSHAGRQVSVAPPLQNEAKPWTAIATTWPRDETTRTQFRPLRAGGQVAV